MSKKDQYKHELINILAGIDGNRLLMDSFLQDLLTPSEYDEIIRRWQIVKLLRAGQTQRVVAEKLGVGIATVTRGSRELLDRSGGFNQVLQRGIR